MYTESGCNRRKNIGICILLTLLLALTVFLAFPRDSHAVETEAAESAEAGGDIDTGAGSALPGEAQITQILESAAPESTGEPAPEGGDAGEPASEGGDAGDPATVAVTDEITDVVFTNDVLPEDPVNEAGGEALPEAQPFDVEANKGVIEDLLTTTTVSVDPQNAIQKAIDEALSRIEADTREITVSVGAGIYEGDIEISATRSIETTTTTIYSDAEGTVLGNTQETAVEEKNYVIPEDFWLRIVSRDAGEDLLSADDGVQINGNIRISGMNVVLAGLYFSLNKRVTVTGDDGTAGPKVEIYGTKKDDTIQVSAEGTSENPADVTVHGGAGNDTIALDAGPSATATLNGDAGDDHISLTSTYQANANGTSEVTVNGGAGSDVVDVDVSIANVVKDGEGVTGVTVNANEASTPDGDPEKDRMHFTGALSTDGTSTAVRDSDTQASFTLKNNGGETVRVLAKQFASFTDTLLNKRTATLDGSAMHAGDLCNYIANLDDQGGNIDLALTGGGLLVNYIMRTPGDVTIERLLAGMANVCIYARNINVTGAVNAVSFVAEGKSFTLEGNGTMHTTGDVLLTMSDDDGQFSTRSMPVLQDIGVEAEGSVLDLLAASGIHIAGVIEAGGNVSLSTATVQTRSLLDVSINGQNVAQPVNFLNIKSGNSEINVPGSINAGGAVTANASTAISFTVSPTGIAGFTVPLSLSIAVSQVYVRVTGSVIANGSVALRADSTVDINTTAFAGKIPVAIAVSIAAVDCHVLVGADNVPGTRVESREGDVTLKSNGVTSLMTKAKRGAGDAGSTNLGVSAYFAAGVGVVDVSAQVIGNANVRADNGSVNIYSDSEERAVTDAVSKRPAAEPAGAGDGGNPSIESIKNSLMAILGSFRTQLGGKADAVIESVEGKDYAIYISDTVNGTISAVNKANSGQVITVTAAPNKGYKLQSIQYKYLPAGATAYQFVPVLPDASGKYVITMPAFDINIVGTFVKKTAAELGVKQEDYDDLYDASGLFSGEDEAASPADPSGDGDEDGLGLTDLFNEGAGTAKPLDTGRMTENSTAADAVTINVADGVNNTEGAVKGGSLLTVVTKADAGRTVAVTVNPTKAGGLATGNYRLKPGSLKFTYLKKSTDATSASPAALKATVDITVDENGEYVFVVPEDISGTDRTVTLHAEWELIPEGQTPAEPTPKASASAQITGALSFSVIINRNNAVISTSGEIRADEVNIIANAVTSASATADATDALDLLVEEGVVPGTTEAGATAATGAQWVDGRDRLVLIETMENGSLVYQKDLSLNTKYVFAIVPANGYDIEERPYPNGTQPARYATLHYTKQDGTAGIQYLLTKTIDTIQTAVEFDIADGNSLPGGYKKGTTLSIGTVFIVKDPAIAASSGGTVNAQYAGNANTILIAGTANGTVSFASSESSPTTGRYAFTITPVTGYRLGEIAPAPSSDPAAPAATPSINFTYTYTKAADAAATPPTLEATVKTSLTVGSGNNYYFDLPSDAKPGTSIVIMAVFVEDTRDIVLGEHANGTITIVPADGAETAAAPAPATATPGAPVVIAQAKADDVIHLNATGVNGYKPGTVSLSYTEGTVAKTLQATLEESTGIYSFTMPNADKGTQLTLSCTFVQNDIPVAIEAVTLGESTESTAENLAAVTVNASRVDVGKEVVVSLTEAGLAKGYKLGSVTGIFMISGGGEDTDVAVGMSQDHP